MIANRDTELVERAVAAIAAVNAENASVLHLEQAQRLLDNTWQALGRAECWESGLLRLRQRQAEARRVAALRGRMVALLGEVREAELENDLTRACDAASIHHGIYWGIVHHGWHEDPVGEVEAAIAEQDAILAQVDPALAVDEPEPEASTSGVDSEVVEALDARIVQLQGALDIEADARAAADEAVSNLSTDVEVAEHWRDVYSLQVEELRAAGQTEQELARRIAVERADIARADAKAGSQVQLLSLVGGGATALVAALLGNQITALPGVVQGLGAGTVVAAMATLGLAASVSWPARRRDDRTQVAVVDDLQAQLDRELKIVAGIADAKFNRLRWATLGLAVTVVLAVITVVAGVAL